jgi:hypothetical protein
MLVVREEWKTKLNLPVRFQWWVVKSLRTLKGGTVKATLIHADDTLSAEATATFPNGVVRDPWRVARLSQRDWEAVWNGRPDAP